MGDELFVKLRDCFTAGYTLPQYCIDNGIKRPLFVSEKKYELFLWEVHVQFQYDKRMMAQFCFNDADESTIEVYTGAADVQKLYIKNFSTMNFNNFDTIILLTKKNLDVKDKQIISFDNLEHFFIQHTYVEIPLMHFLKLYPKVKLILTNFPKITRYESVKKFFSREIWDDTTLIETLRKRKSDDIKTPFDNFGYGNQEVYEMMKAPKIKVNSDGSTTMINDDYPLLKIENGKRATAYQPKKFLNRIYIFGTCHHYGIAAPFDKTIESYLQKMLNENNLPYRVENEGQCYFRRYQDIFYNLNKHNFMPGDIVIIYCGRIVTTSSYLPFCDVSTAFDQSNDYLKIFTTRYHINELGYKLLAEKYFKFLTENNFFRDVEFNYPIPPPTYHRYGIPPWTEQSSINISVNEELEIYKKQLKARRPQIGALVMNCNPFTLGHLHLVEYAAAKVVKLYIFVVEEDKSEFPFADRIELVRQGVKDFSNVEVLPSGKFIISQQTFSGYFNKASLQDVAVDSSEDVEIFAKEIAPTLGITIRFAGEEPKDNVTRQYNETMKRILPRYGVEFCEIPRKEFSGEPISASTVRAALKNGDINKVKSLVPATTFNYLRKRQHPKFFTARVDIKLVTTTGDFQILSVSDDKASVDKPALFQTGGIGYQIQSCAGKLEFVAKATVDGQIWLNLLVMDSTLNATIDYTKLIVNGEAILNELTSVCCDKPYFYNMATKADAEIKIQVEWLPHNN